MSLTQKMRSLGWPTYPFSGWLCLFLLPAWAGFLPGAGVLWVIHRNLWTPVSRTEWIVCASLNHHRDLQKDGPCHHQSQQMEKGQVSLTLIGWEDGVRNPHGWTETLQRKADIRCRSILLMKPALSWLSSFSLEASLILSWNRSFFSIISFLYFPWYVLLLSAC